MMWALFVPRWAFENLERFCDTEVWRLQKENRQLKERESARAACFAALERELEGLRGERDGLRRELGELLEQKSALEADNRDLRFRLDTVRAELSRTRHNEKTLKLMNGALEARVGPGGEE